MAKLYIISLLIALIGVVAGNPALYDALDDSTGVGKSNIDLATITFHINQEQCTELRKHKSELQKQDLNRTEEFHDHNNCRYWGATGGHHCTGKLYKIFHICGDFKPNLGWKTDEGCIRNRNEKNRLKDVRNQQLREWKQSVRNGLGDIERALAAGHCDVKKRHHSI